VHILTVFRERDDVVYALFPETPYSRKPKECMAFSMDRGFHAVDYDSFMFHSRTVKKKDFRELLDHLRSLGHDPSVIQQASFIMHERRKKAAEEYKLEK
jgi:hypothetical protein